MRVLRQNSSKETLSGFNPKNAALMRSEFFNRDPRKVAQELLGKVLVRREGRAILAGRIVETEAYLGIGDAAAHAAAGRTRRNSVLFGPPGRAYVYFIYGLHYCFNVSCLPDHVAGGVLIRALEPLAGLAEMEAARGLASKKVSDRRLLTSGPGRLCEALGITAKRDNGKNLLAASSDLQLFDDGYTPGRVTITSRIGITKAAEHPFRYVISGNSFVSGKIVR